MTEDEAFRLVRREMAAARREAGLCPDRNEPRGEHSRCPKHLAVHAKRERARKAAKRSQ